MVPKGLQQSQLQALRKHNTAGVGPGQTRAGQGAVKNWRELAIPLAGERQLSSESSENELPGSKLTFGMFQLSA